MPRVDLQVELRSHNLVTSCIYDDDGRQNVARAWDSRMKLMFFLAELLNLFYFTNTDLFFYAHYLLHMYSKSNYIFANLDLAERYVFHFVSEDVEIALVS